jgi:hypothetical protein
MKNFSSWLVLSRPRSSLAIVAAVVVDASLISSSLAVRFEPNLVGEKNAAHASAGREEQKTTKLERRNDFF